MAPKTIQIETFDKPFVERRRFSRRADDYHAENLHSIFTSFEQVGRHVFLLNAKGRVIYRSGKIDALICDQVPMRLFPRFCLSEPSNASQFQVFMDGINEPRSGKSFSSSQSCIMLLKRQTSGPLLLSCFLLSRHEEDGAKILGVLSDPSCVAESQWRAFQSLFNLTAAELRLCLALADGLSLAEYGQKYQVTSNTSRSQLKGVFTKTETRRQGDLVRLIFLLTRL